MRFNNHSKINGTHALLSPSSPSWINYEPDKLDDVISSSFAARRGTALHELAQRLITLRQNMPDTRATLNAYVNDCIGFRMRPEVMLFYSFNCFGTADAISFRDQLLRISDLKNGATPAKFPQLRVYAALFCLEYGYLPNDIDIELRIYQNDDIELEEPESSDIRQIMDQIVYADRRIDRLREEELG